MNRREALIYARKLLADSNIEEAALEAEILVRHILNIDRAKLFTDLESVLTTQQESDYLSKLDIRTKGTPVAYITGTREFYGLDFYVDDSVLIPRPETELLVEKTIEIASNYSSPVIADIGTGCGNIAVSLAVNLPQFTVVATDISEKALKTAQRNCERHDVKNRIQLLAGDLLEPVKEPVDIIVSNLPYVRTADLPAVNTSGYEPPLALDGGDDGLDVIRRLCAQINNKLKPGGSLLLEIGLGQTERIINLLSRQFPLAEKLVFPDLNNIERLIVLTR